MPKCQYVIQISIKIRYCQLKSLRYFRYRINTYKTRASQIRIFQIKFIYLYQLGHFYYCPFFRQELKASIVSTIVAIFLGTFFFVTSFCKHVNHFCPKRAKYSSAYCKYLLFHGSPPFARFVSPAKKRMRTRASKDDGPSLTGTTMDI